MFLFQLQEYIVSQYIPPLILFSDSVIKTSFALSFTICNGMQEWGTQENTKKQIKLLRMLYGEANSEKEK